MLSFSAAAQNSTLKWQQKREMDMKNKRKKNRIERNVQIAINGFNRPVEFLLLFNILPNWKGTIIQNVHGFVQLVALYVCTDKYRYIEFNHEIAIDFGGDSSIERLRSRLQLHNITNVCLAYDTIGS